MTKEKVYAFWNGKNIDGSNKVGSEDLLNAQRTSKTAQKYDVSSETVSTDNLQNNDTNTTK